MSFRIRLTSAAHDDIRHILRWLEERSPSGAEAWYQKWMEILARLEERAENFGLAPESDEHSEPIRQILFKTRRGRIYRALFVVREGDVFILHVRGPGQRFLNPEELR